MLKNKFTSRFQISTDPTKGNAVDFHVYYQHILKQLVPEERNKNGVAKIKC